jgi:hypothetical protein
MTVELRPDLRRKYLSLGVGELVAALVFTAIAAAVIAPRLEHGSDAAALWSALIPLLVILVQAGVYWLAARGWVGRRPMPAGFAATYRWFRVVDVVLLVAGLVGLVMWWPSSVGAALGLSAVWLFGVLEYVNYFVVRLSYPIGRWFTTVGQWRTPRLIQDLRSAARF